MQVQSDADVRPCLVVTFPLQLPPLFPSLLPHHATTTNHKLILHLYLSMRCLCFYRERQPTPHARLFPSHTHCVYWMLQPLPSSRLSGFGLRKNQGLGQFSARAVAVGLSLVWAWLQLALLVPPYPKH